MSTKSIYILFCGESEKIILELQANTPTSISGSLIVLFIVVEILYFILISPFSIIKNVNREIIINII